MIKISGMAAGLAEIADGLARVFSLGNLHLNWAFRVTAWFEMRRIFKPGRGG